MMFGFLKISWIWSENFYIILFNIVNHKYIFNKLCFTMVDKSAYLYFMLL